MPTIEQQLEELHKRNCLVCTPEAKPNAEAFVGGLYDLFDPRPKLLRAMRGNDNAREGHVPGVRARNAPREMR